LQDEIALVDTASEMCGSKLNVWHGARVRHRPQQGAIQKEARTPDEIMKTRFQTFRPLQIPGRALLAAVTALALLTAQLTAGDVKSALPATTLSKLDQHLVLVVKKSRGESPFDKPTTLQPDVYQFNGRVLVEIEGSASKELSDQVTSLGGQLVAGWGTATTFRVWIPFAKLETLASRADIKSISAARPTITHRLKH
jgi:hypothetical protein